MTLSQKAKELCIFFSTHCPHPRWRLWLLRKGGIEVGEKTVISYGMHVIMPWEGRITIGNRCAIGHGVVLIGESHPNWSLLAKHFPMTAGHLDIRDDCWVGVNAVIYPGVTVGPQSVVAPGAVVTRDVPPYSIVAGVPAKKIKDLPPVNPPGEKAAAG